MDFKIDYEDAEYISNKIISGKLSADALTQRIGRALRKEDPSYYFTLKFAQALVAYKRKVK